jgi:hypothetical protein
MSREGRSEKGEGNGAEIASNALPCEGLPFSVPPSLFTPLGINREAFRQRGDLFTYCRNIGRVVRIVE